MVYARLLPVGQIYQLPIFIKLYWNFIKIPFCVALHHVHSSSRVEVFWQRLCGPKGLKYLLSGLTGKVDPCYRLLSINEVFIHSFVQRLNTLKVSTGNVCNLPKVTQIDRVEPGFESRCSDFRIHFLKSQYYTPFSVLISCVNLS